MRGAVGKGDTGNESCSLWGDFRWIVWEDCVERSETLAGDSHTVRGQMGDTASKRFAGRIWGRALQAALRLRADISFAVVDVFIIVAGYTMATALRMLDGAVERPALFWTGLGRILPILVAVHLLANLATGTYGHMWEYASISEARKVIISNIAAAGVIVLVVTPLADVITDGPRRFPYGVAIVGSFLVLAGMGLIRFRSRLFSLRRSIAADHPVTLVVGDGKSAADFVREVLRLGQSAEMAGFVSPGQGAHSSPAGRTSDPRQPRRTSGARARAQGPTGRGGRRGRERPDQTGR